MANGQLHTTATGDRRPDPATGDTVLELESVAKRYGAETVISDLSLSVREGEILTLLGPSGCGKTTTLRLVAGLERPDAGRIALQGERVAGADRFVPPEERDVGVVFQEFALFPHLTARENVAFGLRDRDERERDARVDELLDLVGLEAQGGAYPDELSGGQRQRIALARALAPEPELLLLDEPFSNLDADLRVEMREEVRRIIAETGVTAVSVTHDQEEALSISDRVAVMNDGDIEQIDRPQKVFQQPESRFVAGFLGHASFLAGEVRADGVDTAVGRVRRDAVTDLTDRHDGATVDLLVRPDDVTAAPADDGAADGRVVYRRYLGPTALYRVELESGETLECMHNHADRIDVGERVAVRVTADHDLAWFPAD
ncbi:ABC transporter ATP-binding protein [Haloterrigena sp. SYSU A558-1]|uniref:Molybdate/tungstate import ATP-binding protein WtpC n=1 Tax=Haloterrigena gelatinilytica TaxID=2741724 RepID=A0A8J8GJT9_9EURY|nr:ABC transporter ATP-binding protein [Haloterrigena gelatinilytica]NUB91294.1 ABC transporter ATP-binding protein [Haloterrigena gelatinilytica]NUC72963.1 ABC transporter ATP-binding protein [Haloterrigena gelatinilytica]